MRKCSSKFDCSRDDGVYYNELETRVRLSKRRLKAGQQIGNSKLVVKHRYNGSFVDMI